MGKHYLFVLAALIGAPLASQAQWLNHRDPSTPRSPDGKPNLTAPAPRVNGKPDFSGVWESQGTPRAELAALFPPGVGLLPGGVNGLGEDDPQKYFLNVLADFKPGTEPLTPAAAARLRQQMQNPSALEALCKPAGGSPLGELIPEPYKIVQTPKVMLVLYESDSVYRQIHLDGRQHPVDPQPAWLGYSIGHWDGDTLIVEATGFNDLGALDAMGHFHSEQMKLTQRFRRRDFGHMEIEMTLEDPKVFTRPVTFVSKHILFPDTDVMESYCAESEHDLAHMQGPKPKKP